MSGGGRLRRGLRRFAASSEEMHAEELRRDQLTHSDVTIEDAPDRELVTVRGVLRTVTLRPRGGVPALEAELYDGTGVLTLIFLGRRRISGVAPGRSVRVTGRIGRHEGTRLLYNPRYELLP
ncbi:OB-fold nucleic acid binding domain-containing protein [Nocardioides sp. GXQ0305]|uniref:OB-fold nucleic acid binding domain-containing protein n=1 Tax=Nocardioides sp. GXQ0305 TaxID=3423912 RepID=UPI003D7ED5D9